jgi:hypothetical protein
MSWRMCRTILRELSKKEYEGESKKDSHIFSKVELASNKNTSMENSLIVDFQPFEFVSSSLL